MRYRGARARKSPLAALAGELLYRQISQADPPEKVWLDLALLGRNPSWTRRHGLAGFFLMPTLAESLTTSRPTGPQFRWSALAPLLADSTFLSACSAICRPTAGLPSSSCNISTPNTT